MECGACCALFRVAFLRVEADDSMGGTVPAALTVAIGNDRLAMRGTDGFNKRCVALVGAIGVRVSCRIYDQRPSSCRGFAASWKQNRANPVCDRARVSYGLTPFSIY